jgi:NADH-quinone oxidoreductase subunit G
MPDTEAETAVAITVDGKAVEARKGELLIDAAERNGVYIPRFCYHHRMEPVGMCRMCLVEVDTGRGPALQPSCMLTVAPDMVVQTESSAAKKAQDGVLEFLLINHPLDCPVCDKGGECPLQDQTLSYGPGESRMVEEKRHYEKPIPISDHILLDRERCILCDRCTRFAKDVAGDAFIHFMDRGNGSQINVFPDHPFATYFGGNTVQICPVGALTAEPYRFKARPWDLEVVESTCQSCSVGCRIVIDSSRDQVLRYQGVDSDPVNWSWLCDKGRFGFQAIESPDRIGQPLVRGTGDAHVETRWSDALTVAAKALKGAEPSRVAVLGGARLTNESAYAWAKLAKGVIGTDHVDAQMGDGLPAEVVASLPRATIDEACADGGTLLVLDVDPKEELPVLFLRIRDAVTRHGATVVELSTHESSLSSLAAHSVRTTPGAMHELVDRLVSGDGDLGPLRDQLAKGPFTVLLGRGSLAEGPEATVAAAASLIEAFDGVRFLSGLRRANVHGALDMGLAPGLLPGRVALDEGRNWFGEQWATVPDAAGLDAAGILAAAANGAIDVLVLLGADPLNDFPDHDLAVRGMEGAATVIAVDTFLTDSSVNADVVLPAAGFAEVDGTTTNLEGRVSLVRQKVTPPGTARADWVIAAELAFRLGADLGFTTVEEIWAEVERVSPAHAAMTLDALAAQPDGILVRTEAVEGETAAPSGDVTGDQSADGTHMAAHGEVAEHAAAADAADTAGETEAKEADATAAQAAQEANDVDGADADADADASEAAATAPPTGGDVAPGPVRPEKPATVSFEQRAGTHQAPAIDAYSLRLVTVRRMYDRGTLLNHSPSLANQRRGSELAAHPAVLERLGLTAGQQVTVTSAKGSLTTALHIDASLAEGTITLAWNQGDPSPAVLIDAEAPVTEVRLETTS